MSIWGAFTNSKTAMIAFSHSMNTISQNISNVSTNGYKRGDSLFMTMLSESTPRANIFGVQGGHRNLLDQQGIVTPSTNWTDLAIEGEGFFVVNSSAGGDGETLYTRNGAFLAAAADADGDGVEETYLTDGSGHFLMGWAADANGGFNTNGSLSAVHVRRDAIHPGLPTTQAQPLMNVDRSAQSAQELTFAVFDTSANPQQLDMNWVPTAGNAWDVTFSVSGGTVAAPATVTVAFDGEGNVISPPTAPNITIDWQDGTTSTIAIDLSTTTQFAGGSDVFSVDQNGYASATLKGFSFDDDGVLYGDFHNGLSRPLYKLPLADFVAPNELEPRSGGVYAATPEAGDLALRDAANAAGGGRFVPKALEASTVDLAQEFTRMIITQRAYSSAATAFKTADEMNTLARDLMR